MAQSITPLASQTLRLCAQLSNFAYRSGNPEQVISSDSNVAKESLCALINGVSPRSERVITFERFYSHSWFLSPRNQVRWFRSYS